MEEIHIGSTSSNDLSVNDSDDEEEWRKEITELKRFKAEFEEGEENDSECESIESHETFNVLNVILSCSEYSASPDKVLLMNRTLIYMLKQMKSQVIANLRANAEKQEALFEELKSLHEKKSSPPASVLKCGMPYFKLPNDWAQPPNMYCQQHKKLGFATPDLFARNSICWSLKDSKHLKQLVIDFTREKKLVELENKVRLMSRFGSSRKAFENASKQLVKHKNMDGKGIDADKVDWLRVSCSLGCSFTPTECQAQWQYFVNPDINNSKWTVAEKNIFFPLVKKLGFQSWDKIAQLHGHGRTGLQCCIMFHRSIVEIPTQCSSADNEKFIALYNCYKHKRRPFLKISFFLDCTFYDCKARLRHLKVAKIPLYSTNTLVKRDLKAAFSHASKIKRMCLTQKHERLNNRSSFTSDEDYLLLEAVVNHGKKWDIVFQAVPGRNQMEVRQRYEQLIKFSKDVLKSIDKSASTLELDLLPTQMKADFGQNVWSILQLFWEPSQRSIARSLYGLPLGNKMSPATQQLLKILEFGHRNLFGPRFKVPRTKDGQIKMVNNLAVISQALELPFVPGEVTKKLQISVQNTSKTNQIQCVENILLHLNECEVPDLSPSLTRSFIPPNILTLVGARVLFAIQGLLNSQAKLSLPISRTVVNPSISSQDRLRPCQAKERLKNRIFSMFFLSQCIAKVSECPGHTVSHVPSVKTKKRKLTSLQRKRALRKLACKRWNKSVEESSEATDKKRRKKGKSPPLSNGLKKAKMIRVTKNVGTPVLVENINYN